MLPRDAKAQNFRTRGTWVKKIRLDVIAEEEAFKSSVDHQKKKPRRVWHRRRWQSHRSAD